MERKSGHEPGWIALRSELEKALEHEIRLVADDNATIQDLLDCYLYTKRLSAKAFQALVVEKDQQEDEQWTSLSARLAIQMNKNLVALPLWVRKVPHQSFTHRSLFSMLRSRLADYVPADMLRIVTGDAVHAERRVRELRDLGLSITAEKVSGIDSYRLESLEIEYSCVYDIARHNIGDARGVTKQLKDQLLRLVDEAEQRR